MGRLSRRSNPTNLIQIDKSRINIAVVETNGKRHFTLQRLDLQDLNLPPELRVICMARAANTNKRFDLGSAGNWSKEPQALDELDRSGFLRFRILLHDQKNPQLVASAEGLRPHDDTRSESLIPMEPAELGEQLWRLDIAGDEGPVLKYNVMVFPSAAGVQNYLPFAALVLPDALRTIMRTIASDPACLDDAGDILNAWAGWLDAIGAGRPPRDEDEGEAAEWCEQVVDMFCRRHLFASQLRIALTESGAQ